MREGQLQKVPYILVLGNNERNERTVTFRLHGQQESTTIGLEEFLSKIKTEIETKGNN
jgi:threonyl-tRNA synthetase